jgi:molybdopterin converting factor small subunit
MQVTVRYMSQLKREAACSSECVEVRDGSSLTDLLVHVAHQHGDAFRGMLLDETSTPRKSLLFFVGDEHSDVSRPLCHGDEVTILAPMAGG